MRYLWLFFCALCGLFAACKFDADDLPVERPFVRDFYAQGAWRDTGQTTPFVLFDYTVGFPVQQGFSRTVRSENETEISGGYKRIQANFMGSSSSHPMFHIAFFSDSPAPPNGSPAWSAAELEALLPVGRVFPIAGADREVEVGLRIPVEGSDFLQIHSDSKLAPIPEGWVQVLDVEDYTWEIATFSGQTVTRRGKKVLVAFEAKLGRRAFDSPIWPVIGETEVRDGEASLYLEYF